jgi:hypothetical protein
MRATKSYPHYVMQNVLVTKKGNRDQVAARLTLLFARTAPVAVILRRGPSKWMQLVKWNTDSDEFESGQWFHGKIYGGRADLSPDGSLFIYFAQKINGRSIKDTEYTYAWTAISRPPYLKALALWPKGDCWHGGGLFINESTILLNHKQEVSKPHPNHEPKGINVVLKEHVHGEDDPIYSERLARDGWQERQEWVVEFGGKHYCYHTLQKGIREKPNRDGSRVIRLTRSIERLDYSEQFVLVDLVSGTELALDRASWADWDFRGRLVYARDGKVFAGTFDESRQITERELIDLNNSRPESIATPEWATRW